MTIYKITNLVNEKIYIGQTIQKLSKRISFHFSNSGNSVIGKAIQKYGKENFLVEVLSECFNKEDLTSLESFYIRKFRSLAPNGYNLVEAKEVAGYSEQTRKKMSDSAKKALQNPELQKRISAIRKGKPAVNREAVYCEQTGEIFHSFTQAGRFAKVSQSCMSMHINGTRSSCKKLTFKKVG